MKSPGQDQLTGSYAEDCIATRETLDRIGDKWSVFAIVTLDAGPLRFNALKRTLHGISQRVLTQTLRGLERDGLVARTVFPTVPPSVEYALTPLGRTLVAPLASLASWANQNAGTVRDARAAFDRSARSTGAEPAKPATSVS